MANVAIFEPGQEPVYLLSVNTPDYSSNPNVLVNPDISSLQNVPKKYWKRVGNAVAEMSQVEKDVISAQELLKKKASADNFDVSLNDIFTALIKIINVRLPSGQKITKQELIDAIKTEVK